MHEGGRTEGLTRQPLVDDAASDASWDGVFVLPRSDIRLRSRLRYGVVRLLLWKLKARHVAMAGVLSTGALTAACAAAVKSGPDQPPVAIAEIDRSHAVLPQQAAVSSEITPSESEQAAIGAEPAATPPKIVVASAEPDVVPDEAPLSSPVVSDETRWPSFSNQGTASDRALTQLVAFKSAPFPYNGLQPSGGAFLDIQRDGQRGHRTRMGRILWESETFNDNRVLVHVPAGFDPSRPAVMVVFFHGYGATLERDVLARQQVPAQISASGANAVLVAPQFAVDARDPSAGHFWEPGGFRRFLDEAAVRLARMTGNPSNATSFRHMPLVIVAYSGGFAPAAFCIKDLGASRKVRGVLMLDAAYGEFERYANLAAADRSTFFVSAYTHFTQFQNAALRKMLADRGVPSSSSLEGPLSVGGAYFLAAESPHNDYVTRSWTEDPIRDVLTRLPELRLREPQSVAAVDLTPTASIP